MEGRKIEVEIVALTNSISGSHSYAIIIGEVNGVRQIPIVIGQYEAQSIAVSLENMKNARPLTHDLMKNMMDIYLISLKEVVIYKLKEGVFYSKLVCENDNGIEEIDSRTSDALALAVRFDVPIYTYENILNEAGVVDKTKEGGGAETRTSERTGERDTNPKTQNNLKDLSKEELDDLLNDAIEREDYIRAASIRDELNNRK